MTHVLYFICIHCALRLTSSPNFDFQNLIFILVPNTIFHLLCAGPNVLSFRFRARNIR